MRLSRHIERRKANDDNMDVCLSPRLARPCERAMSEVNLDLVTLE